MSFSNRLLAHEQSSRIMKRSTSAFVSIDKAHEQRGFADATVQLVQDLQIFRNETRLKDQVLRGITGDRELGRYDQVGPGRGEALIRLEDPLEVAAQIANGRIDLGEADFHCP